MQNFSQIYTIEASGEDLASLLVNWLAEILYIAVTKKWYFIDIIIKEFSTAKIIANAKITEAQIQREVKAVTYHELKIQQQKNGHFFADVVYDI